MLTHFYLWPVAGNYLVGFRDCWFSYPLQCICNECDIPLTVYVDITHAHLADPSRQSWTRFDDSCENNTQSARKLLQSHNTERPRMPH